MNTNPDRKPWHDAVDQLIEAVNEDPLEGFRSTLEEQSELKKWENSRGLNRALDDLKQFALLGYTDAVELLVTIAEDISSFLEELMPLSERRDGANDTAKASSSKRKPQDDGPLTDWRSKPDEAGDRLHKAITEHYQSCNVEFNELLKKLTSTK